MIAASLSVAALATAWTAWLTRSLRLATCGAVAGLVLGALEGHDPLILVPLLAGGIVWTITEIRSGEIDDIVTLPLIGYLAAVDLYRAGPDLVGAAAAAVARAAANPSSSPIAHAIVVGGAALTRTGPLPAIIVLCLFAVGWAVPAFRWWFDAHVGGWGDVKAVLAVTFAAQSFIAFLDMITLALAFALVAAVWKLARRDPSGLRLGPFLALGIVLAQFLSPWSSRLERPTQAAMSGSCSLPPPAPGRCV